MDIQDSTRPCSDTDNENDYYSYDANRFGNAFVNINVKIH